MSTCCSSQIEGVVPAVDLMICKVKNCILGRFKFAKVMQYRMFVRGLYGIARKTDLNS